MGVCSETLQKASPFYLADANKHSGITRFFCIGSETRLG